jgi:hypothetical protein
MILVHILFAFFSAVKFIVHSIEHLIAGQAFWRKSWALHVGWRLLKIMDIVLAVLWKKSRTLIVICLLLRRSLQVYLLEPLVAIECVSDKLFVLLHLKNPSVELALSLQERRVLVLLHVLWRDSLIS